MELTEQQTFVITKIICNPAELYNITKRIDYIKNWRTEEDFTINPHLAFWLRPEGFIDVERHSSLLSLSSEISVLLFEYIWSRENKEFELIGGYFYGETD